MRITNGVKLTTMIVALVVGSIVASIAVVSSVIYINLHARSVSASFDQQVANIGVAVTLLERRISGAMLNWRADGGVEAFEVWSMPPVQVQEVDPVTRVTGQEAAIYVFDTESKQLVSKATSLLDADGKRLSEQVLDPESPAYASVIAGVQYAVPIVVNATPFLGAMQPIRKVEGEVLGAIFVGTPMSEVEAAANDILGLVLVAGAAVTIGIGLIGLLMAQRIVRPIPRLADAMQIIAGGDYEVEVPYTARANEVGAMARSVEVFRENGQRVSQMTEAEATRIVSEQKNRQEMMAALQRAFGDVVDSAIAGDFTQRVEVEFPDPELNGLAESINRLVGNFDQGVTETGAVLSALAHQDLTSRMTGDYEGAFGRLQAHLNSVANKLAEVMAQLRRASNSLRTATGEILSGANDLSERTTRQAATIEETSATMERLAETVAHNAKRARAASGNAEHVSKAAEDGAQVMGAATAAMERITDSSARISSIIGMIDDIAFQTNLLALNASVEAARAGDAGKGFAVVAVEVRRLAQSAANASSEVKALIEQSNNEVTNGSALVMAAAGKLSTMLAKIRENTAALEAISDDSREQAAAIEQVSAAVRQLDEMTQHNVSLVEETNAAIGQTEAQAVELDAIIDVFRLEPAPSIVPTDEELAFEADLVGDVTREASEPSRLRGVK